MNTQNKYFDLAFQYIKRTNIFILVFVISFALTSCKKFLEIEIPRSNIEKNEVFSNDVTATAAVLGMFAEMYTGSGDKVASGRPNALSALAGLSSDELFHPSASDFLLLEFQNNEIVPNNGYTSALWTSFYKIIYQANTIIEGIKSSSGITLSGRNQLLGEAYFVRGFCNFYLAHLYGNVPLVLTTDYNANAVITRTDKAQVLDQVLADFLQSHQLLENEYIAISQERIRPNKSAASAMLSRVYLFLKDWNNAELYASSVIDQISVYSLENNVNDVFLKNSRETIFQIRPITHNLNENGATNEAINFSPDYALYYNVCTSELAGAFEGNDLRYSNWLATATDGMNSYFTPAKYKDVNISTPLTEYSMVIHLAELYLIRAEAKAMLNNLIGPNSARSDIDSIRLRANLPPTTATTQQDLLAAIMQERRVELFSEWGHRWFDLKRWEKADEVLYPLKGANWQPTDVLYPIPQDEINKNPNLKPQNDGYN